MSKRARHGNLSVSANLLRSCSGDKEWRDWSSLPSVLVEEIAGWLLRYDAAEYLRQRAACKEWRICTANAKGGTDQLDSLFRPPRWTMLSNNTDGTARRFLNVGTGACYNVDLPELSTHHLEATTEGLLLLRHKASQAARLLNPLTRALIDLPPITAELGAVHDGWTGERPYRSRHRVYAGISDETTPATVVLIMRSTALCAIVACARPGDERRNVMGRDGWASIPLVYTGFSYMSTLMLQGRVYLVTFEGNILQVEIHPTPRLVPVVLDQVLVPDDVTSYLVPADHDHHVMLMVRYYRSRSLRHLSVPERRRIKRRKGTDVIKLTIPESASRYSWQLLEVFEVDLAGKRLLQVDGIGRRAVFVGEVACLSLCTDMVPSVAGNAVYIGVNAFFSSIGVRYLGNKTFDPPFDFIPIPKDVKTGGSGEWQQNLVPFARPCTLQEYLVCCTGFKDCIND